MDQSHEIQEVIYLLQVNHSENDKWKQLQKNNVAGYHRNMETAEETIFE